jgi:hypothetical protein
MKACKADWVAALLRVAGHQPRLAACLASTELLAGQLADVPDAAEAVRSAVRCAAAAAAPLHIAVS